MAMRRHGKPSETNIPARLDIWAAGIGLALLSAASLAFEVVLTHLFSELFQYNFAFLAVSTAVLGLGLGAVISYRLNSLDEANYRAWFSHVAAVVAILLPFMVILFIMTGFIPGYVLQIVLGLLPFVFIGLCTSRLYTIFNVKAAWLYGFDLIGSAVGLIGVLALLNLVSAASAGILLGIFAALSAILFAGKEKQTQIIPVVALLMVILLFVINQFTHLVDLPKVSAATIPPDKTMFTTLEQGDNQLIDSAYSSYARVDLVTGNSPDEMYVFTNAGAGSYMLAFNGDLRKVQWLQNRVEYLPFAGFSAQNTLILGAGAGKDILQALLDGSKAITAVEVNPAMVAITRKYASYNGNILDYPGVTTVVADGRDYVHRSSKMYDMIYMNLVYSQAPAPGSNALSEAYVFTTEAFQDYWKHLSGQGRLAIVAHQGLEGSRAMITALQALQNEGISPKDALKHTALMMYSNSADPNQSTSVLIVQKSELTDAQISTINSAGAAVGMTPLFLPKIYETLFRGLNTGNVTLAQFLVQPSGYNLFPTTDDQPFFFNLNPGIPDALKILLAVSCGAMLFYLLALIGSKNRPKVTQLIFFGGLGVGYFMIEMPLIQRSQLVTANPTLAMVIVLAVLLLGGGIASFLSTRWTNEHLWNRIAVATLIIAGLSALMGFFQPDFIQAISRLSVLPRLAAGGISLLPLGFLMGIPFANGLRLVSVRNKRTLPYLWGWNAVTAVIGSAVAASLAMVVGFQINMLIGAGCYLIVAFSAWMMAHRG